MRACMACVESRWRRIRVASCLVLRGLRGGGDGLRLGMDVFERVGLKVGCCWNEIGWVRRVSRRF